jgi:hypothetical protein
MAGLFPFVAEVRGQRLNALLALCALVRADGVADWEAAVLGAAVDALTGAGRPDPTVPDVLAVLAQGPDPLVQAAQVGSDRFADETTPLRRTLYGLVEGPLKGVFDGPTSTALDLSAPMVCVDLSAVTGALPALQRRRRVRRPTGRRLRRPHHARSGPRRRNHARRTTRPTLGRRPQRGRQHLPHHRTPAAGRWPPGSASTPRPSKVNYVIWQGRIWSRAHDADGWRPYTGGGHYSTSGPTNGHYDHVHVSSTT